MIDFRKCARHLVAAPVIAATLSVAAAPAYAAERSCRGVLEIVHKDGGIDVIGQFTATGREARPNMARREARQRALRCMRVHHDLRAQPSIPSECTRAYGVHDYPFTSEPLAATMDRAFCRARPGLPAQVATVRFRVEGGPRCGVDEVLSVWPIDCTNR